jgi:hypothetical protein
MFARCGLSVSKVCGRDGASSAGTDSRPGESVTRWALEGTQGGRACLGLHHGGTAIAEEREGVISLVLDMFMLEGSDHPS